MGRYDHDSSLLTTVRGEQLSDLVSRGRIQISCWFIRQHQAWRGNHRSSQCDALLLSAGQITDSVRDTVSQSKCFEGIERAKATLPPRGPTDRERECYVLGRCEVRQEMMKLKDKSDSFAAIARQH